MTRTVRTLALALAFLPALASADSVKSKCPDLEKCALSVAELTGAKFVFDGTLLKGAIQASANYELTKENAEEIFTQMLSQNGFTRLPLTEARAYTIIRQREARDSALPVIQADAKTTPEFPKNWDLATLRYRLAQPELAEHICQTIRAFMPANSRVIADEISGQVLLVAEYPILASALATIQTLDVKTSPEKLKRLHEQMRQGRGPELRAPRPEATHH
jgi:hypothetical protein